MAQCGERDGEGVAGPVRCIRSRRDSGLSLRRLTRGEAPEGRPTLQHRQHPPVPGLLDDVGNLVA